MGPGSVVDVHVRLEVTRRREGLLADFALVGFLLKESGKEDISTKYSNKLIHIGIIHISNFRFLSSTCFAKNTKIIVGAGNQNFWCFRNTVNMVQFDQIGVQSPRLG